MSEREREDQNNTTDDKWSEATGTYDQAPGKVADESVTEHEDHADRSDPDNASEQPLGGDSTRFGKP